MDQPTYAVGQAVFTRTDTADFEEVSVPFGNLEELVRLCSQPRPNCVLDKIIVFSMMDGEPCAVTLSFLAATKGQRPVGIEQH